MRRLNLAKCISALFFFFFGDSLIVVRCIRMMHRPLTFQSVSAHHPDVTDSIVRVGIQAVNLCLVRLEKSVVADAAHLR